MRDVTRWLRSARRSRSGQSVVEYALLLVSIGIAAVVALSSLQSHTTRAFGKVTTAVASVTHPGPDGGSSHDDSSDSSGQTDDQSGALGTDRILYSLKGNATPAQLAAFDGALTRYGVQEERKLVRGRISRSRFAATKDAGPDAVCAALRRSGAVEFAEPDRLVAPSVVPDDASYGSQWFHRVIESPAAWDGTTGSRSVIVAVCDTGVDSSHADLAANLVLPGYNSADGSTNTEPVMWHGTATAGCVGAVGNNGTGVCGVNWTVSILPIRISNRSDGAAYFSDMAEGIRWAADHGARVVNVSYGAAGSYTVDSAAAYLREKGGLLFISAGNDGADGSSTYPDFPNSLAVGATTSADVRASFSNYGTYIDLVAPGAGIYTTTTGGYASVSGTSFSSPIAAGVAALVFAADPSLTPDECEADLLSTCTDLGGPGEDNVYGHGRVDAAAAVTAALGGTPDPPDDPANQPPTAVAAASPTTGTAPLNVTLDGSGSTDSDGMIVSYAWDFGDGASGQGQTATHTYGSEGAYTVTLTVTDDDGATDSDSVTVTVTAPTPNAPPTAVASASPASGTAPLKVTFDGRASTDTDGTITSYAWTFGDGASAQGQVVSHAYASAGTYIARLTVTDDDGATDSDTVTVTVSAPNVAPTAVASASPASGTAPLTVTFDGRASSDSDGTITTYAWSFGDGGSAQGQVVAHTYASAGTYIARLTVTDDDGATDSDTVTVTVSAPNVAPTAVAAASPATGTAPLNATLDGRGSSDSDGTITSYAWSFGDGASAQGQVVTHTYGSAGTYVARLTVTDDDGATDSDTVTVTVSAPNVVPTAVAAASPTTGTAPLNVTFDGRGSTDSDGTIQSYAWTFGDGGSAQGQVVTHTYTSAGTYTARLTVTDDDGATDSDSVTVTVAEPAPKVVHVGGLALTTQDLQHGAQVLATILVVDAAGAPVSGATVSGDWDGVVNGADRATTGADGKATITSNRAHKAGTATLTVTGVSIAGYSYDPSQNSASSASVWVTPG